LSCSEMQNLHQLFSLCLFIFGFGESTRRLWFFTLCVIWPRFKIKIKICVICERECDCVTPPG
jgi:hypothetical protein